MNFDDIKEEIKKAPLQKVELSNNDNFSISKKTDNVTESLSFGLAKEPNKPIKKKSSVKADLSKFNRFKLTAEKRKELAEMKYLINGLFVENYHTYIFGPSGAGKTTIMIHLSFEMIKNGYKVVYLYLDGEMGTASKISEEIENKNLEDEFILSADGTMKEYKAMLDEFLKNDNSLKGTVFILDTFKFFTRNINDKNANKDAMHYIKGLQKLGASFISIGHTNKDRKSESGTAEIEQDSDAVLRIDSLEDKSKNTATIKKGGRCRFDVQSKSYEYIRGNPLTVKEIEADIDIEAENRKKEQYEKDKYSISEIQALLRKENGLTQKELIQTIKENNPAIGGNSKIYKLLSTYENKYWKKTNIPHSNAYEYKIIDTTQQRIDEINSRL